MFRFLVNSLGSVLIFAAISAQAAAPEAPPLTGSAWEGTDIWRKPIALYFGEGARIAYKSGKGIWTTGSWHAEGDDVYFEMNNRHVEHTGTRTAAEMYGTGKQIKGYTGSWQLTKLATPPQELSSALGVIQANSYVPKAWAPMLNQAYQYQGEGLSLALMCPTTQACIVSSGVAGSNADATSHTLNPAEDIAGLTRAWAYAQTNKDSSPAPTADAGLLQLRKALQPYLSSASSLSQCSDLKINGSSNYSVCSLAGNANTLVLLMPLMTPCGNGFCGYAIAPLTVVSAVGAKAETELHPVKSAELRPFKPAGLSSPTPACKLPTLPSTTQVIGLSKYRGRDLPFQIDQSGNQASQIDVVVHADKPVVLLVSAYDPTIWNIGWSAGTTIVGVYATGYHRQAVAGLPKSVPIVTAGYDAARKEGCEGTYLELAGMAGEALSKLNKPITRLYAKTTASGVFEVMEATRPVSDFVTSSDRPPESYRDLSSPPAGQAGLAAAVAAGILRPVTPADQEVVRKTFLARAKKADTKMPPVAGMTQDEVLAARLPSIRIGGYVVLREFTYPAGLFGGHAAEFLIPKGVPRPKGNAGHSAVIDLNEVECRGALCG